ncbi:IPTL-CTERM sorting domain-containing protein [Ottowia pentelensis]|uniref:IPTL-CTERM sorting domain-containing protein n=1 Tax=Ottowia pentelensis TaxID=511108 RepID=A0ABV6PRM9_9BURK
MLLKSFARSALALGLTSLALAAQAVTIHVSAVSQPLYLNDTTTTTVTLDNTAGPAMGAAGEFAVALPAEMHFTAVPGNCSPGTAPIRTMACSFGPLAAGASSPQVLSIQADVLYPTADHQNIPPGNPYLFINANITNDGTGAAGDSYDTGPFYIDPRPTPAAIAPVPTLEAWGLGMLSLLIGAAVVRRRRHCA